MGKIIDSKTKDIIQNPISQTLLIPLYFRAKEAERADLGKSAILYDELSKDLIKRIPYDYEKFDKGKFSAVGCCVRAAYFDKKVEDFIALHKNPVVILGGCGLDTRFERLAKKHQTSQIKNFENAIFYEIDLPEVIEIRKKFLSPSPQDRYIQASLLDSNFLKEIYDKHQNCEFIVVIEGVVMYFENQDLSLMLENLCVLGSFELWVDVVGSVFVKKKMQHDTLSKMQAEFKSGINSPQELIKLLPKSAQASEIEHNLYMRNFPLRWGLFGLFIACWPRKLQMKFSFMLGIKVKNKA